jgi:kynurenine formamidase
VGGADVCTPAVPQRRTFRQLGQELSNWGRWGADDELGTLNLITPGCRAAAAALVQRGESVPLGLEFNADGPQRGHDGRTNPLHVMTRTGQTSPDPNGYLYTDDYVMMPLQCGTQVDALAHVSYDGLIYNGVPVESVTARGAASAGVETMRTGIQGRGVLLDIPRSLGVDRLDGGHAITTAQLEACLERQQVAIGSGDVLLVRTGWIQKFLVDGDRDGYMSANPGLALETAEWLRSRDVAFLASDNYSVEVDPAQSEDESFPLHCVLLRDVGMPFGEMFDLEGLAERCATLGRWEFLFTCLPLPVTGAVGSPVSPIATF